MAIEGGQKYDAVVLAAKTTEAKDGKPGIWVNFQCFDGPGAAVGMISKTIWLTLANKEFARKALKTLGATDQQLTSKEFFADVGAALNGAECSIVTEQTEYNGVKRVEVKWINARVKAASATALERAGSLFADMGIGDADDPGFGDEPAY